ncbi:MAG: TonB C-terminal domain-containing protein [Sulfurovum sp.]|nr:TonB C-terminal domain-containing protein [Sulfurovum sp.]
MIEKPLRLIWGIISFGIYLLLLFLLIYYFNTKNIDKSKTYVKKNAERIQVALATTKEISKEVKKSTTQKKPVPKKKSIKKKELKPVDTKKKILKEKIVKKIVKKKPIKPKKKNIKKENLKKPKKTLDLFSDVKVMEKKLDINMTDKPINTTPNSNLIKVVEKRKSATERISSSLKVQESTRSGEENEYFAKVQSMLEDWPAQSDFAGEKAKVVLFIKPSGRFEFKVKSGSSIDAFNEGLIAFLEQLQSIGFGEHIGEKTYEYEAEFIAKE